MTASAAAECDVIVIGAGLAGTAAAIVLGRTGVRVALIDTHATHPNEFRAEKLGEVQMALFEKLGMGGIVGGLTTPLDEVLVYRFGKLFEVETHREYGFAYSGLINGLRAALPPSVRFVVGKVAAVTAGPEMQSVTMADGARLNARLLVLATGLGDALRRGLGVRRIETSKAHSLSLAMTLARPAAACPFPSLVYYADAPRSRIAYLTMFRIGDVMRGNLFVYRQAGDAWTKEFRRRPSEMLCAMAPQIAEMCGDFGLAGPVETRSIDLIETDDYRRDGVVLLGDAFCATCPVPGVGIQRVMTDVDRLCTAHLPRWLETPGMDRAKLASFYDDPVKRMTDEAGMQASRHARAMAVDPGLRWFARRWRNNLVRRALYAVRGPRASPTAIGAALSGSVQVEARM